MVRAGATVSGWVVQCRSCAAAFGAGARAPGLASGQQHQVGAALLDVEGREVRHGLYVVAAHDRVGRVAWHGTEPLGDQRAGIAVAPRQLAAHPDAVGAGERAGRTGIGGGTAQGLGHQIDGLDRRVSPRSTRRFSWPTPMSTGSRGSSVCGHEPPFAGVLSGVACGIGRYLTAWSRVWAGSSSLQSGPSTSCSSAPATVPLSHGRGHAPAPPRGSGTSTPSVSSAGLVADGRGASETAVQVMDELGMRRSPITGVGCSRPSWWRRATWWSGWLVSTCARRRCSYRRPTPRRSP